MTYIAQVKLRERDGWITLDASTTTHGAMALVRSWAWNEPELDAADSCYRILTVSATVRKPLPIDSAFGPGIARPRVLTAVAEPPAETAKTERDPDFAYEIVYKASERRPDETVYADSYRLRSNGFFEFMMRDPIRSIRLISADSVQSLTPRPKHTGFDADGWPTGREK